VLRVARTAVENQAEQSGGCHRGEQGEFVRHRPSSDPLGPTAAHTTQSSHTARTSSQLARTSRHELGGHLGELPADFAAIRTGAERRCVSPPWGQRQDQVKDLPTPRFVRQPFASSQSQLRRCVPPPL
jgi:hypothetical protein